MKKIVALILMILALSAPSAFAADGLPMTLAGIKLGTDIKQYSSFCNMHLASPSPDVPFMSETHLVPGFISGIRGGSLGYANCSNLDKVVRIKLKFYDRSQELFDKLLKKYKKAYGNPDSYEGDAFKNVIAWQWNFNHDGQRVSLMLMWSRKLEIRPGVSIKMSLDSMIDSEYECYKVKMDSHPESDEKTKIRNLADFIAK